MNCTNYEVRHSEPSHSPFSSLLGPNTHLRTLFSNTLSLHSSLNVRDNALQPYRTIDNIVVLYVLIRKLESSQVNKSFELNNNMNFLLKVYISFPRGQNFDL